MAAEMIAPQRCLVPLPSGLAVEDACLVEPLAVTTICRGLGNIGQVLSVVC